MIKLNFLIPILIFLLNSEESNKLCLFCPDYFIDKAKKGYIECLQNELNDNCEENKDVDIKFILNKAQYIEGEDVEGYLLFVNNSEEGKEYLINTEIEITTGKPLEINIIKESDKSNLPMTKICLYKGLSKSFIKLKKDETYGKRFLLNKYFPLWEEGEYKIFLKFDNCYMLRPDYMKMYNIDNVEDVFIGIKVIENKFSIVKKEKQKK